MFLSWIDFESETGSSLLDPYDVHGFTWFDDQKAMRESYTDLSVDQRPIGNVRWVSVGSKYFATSLLSKEELIQGALYKEGALYSIRVTGAADHLAVSVVAGPKHAAEYAVLVPGRQNINKAKSRHK